MRSHYACQYLFFVSILLLDLCHNWVSSLTRRRKTSGIGHTKALAGGRKSPPQVYRWQVGWQTIGIRGGRTVTLQIHADEENQEVRSNARHSGSSIEQTGNRGRSRCQTGLAFSCCPSDGWSHLARGQPFSAALRSGKAQREIRGTGPGSGRMSVS